ncbi:hypothetical protein KW783_00320 [Candidatus Parcubacteria bacterium]|nr:hypothetical protein [Candidatus Parcubacteria bacterium]
MENKRTHKGLGLAALLALGAYFLYGTKRGERHRKKIEGWVSEMRDEVMDKLSKATDITREKYNDIVDVAVAKYKDMKGIDMAELRELTSELRSYWEKISARLDETAKDELKRARRAR